MENISDHITYGEATSTSTGLPNDPQPHQIELMKAVASQVFEPLRKAMGDKAIGINSFFRSATVNKSIGGAHKIIDGKYIATSQHCKGLAIDIRGIHSTNAELFFHILDKLDYDQVIWEKGDKKQPRWVHVSYKSKEKNRKQALVLRNGQYLPFDESLCVRPEKKASPKKASPKKAAAPKKVKAKTKKNAKAKS